MLRHNSIYAAFPAAQDAEKAAGALLDHGVRAASVSFIVPPANTQSPILAGTPHVTGALPTVFAPVPADLPVPDVNAPAPSVTGAINLNTGTRVGEDTSVTHAGTGYGYDALGAEIPGTRSTMPTTYMPAANPADPIPINTPLRSAPGIVRTDVLEKYGATSAQAF